MAHDESTDDIDPRHVRRFEKLARDMNKLLGEIAEYCPAANLYFSNETWNLMTGPSHDGPNQKQRQDRVVTSVLVPRSGGGDW